MSLPPAEDDECACRVCRFTFGLDLPVVKVESLADLQTQTRELSVAIFRHWILLNKTLKRCEDIIQKRWMKKNNSQRLAILLAAWPGMAATHRPDFASLRDISDKGCRRRLNREKEREYNLWPFINQEDLVQPSNLLMFLNSRGRCLPDKFAFGDRVLTHAGNTSSCKSDDINERRMVLYGKKTPASYGALSTFVEGDDIDMLGMHPQTGLLVLEIQERILHFLVKCCRFILHDMEIAEMDLRPTEKPKLTASTSLSTWRTMTALTNEAPYRMPQQLDLDRLRMLVEAKRSEAEEHIWSMREDPGYFASQVQDWADHTTEMVLDKYRMRHSSVGKPDFWSRLCKSVVTHAYRSLIYFDELYNQLEILTRLTKTHEKHIHPTKRLPPILEESYQRLDKLVEEMRHGPLNDLVVGHPASPPMRSGFERSVHDRMPSYHNLISKAKRGPKWRVQVLFRALLSEDQHKKHGLVNLVGEIQRTLDEHSADSDAITPWVANRFADLALVVEVKHQLDLFQPWSTMWRHNSDPVLQEMDFEGTALVHDVIDEAITCMKLDVDHSNFAYPSEKRRTEATVKRMRESEKALDSMWKKIDKHAAVHTGYTLHVFLADFLREGKRRLQRTPAWVEPKKCDSSAPTGQQPAAEWILKSLPLQQLDPNARCSHPGKAKLLEGTTPQKIKPKSRPTTSPHKEEEQDKPAATATDVESRKTVTVNKRAYKVFSTLFHVPSANEQHSQGEVAWIDFLHAMTSIGFSPEKLYGSSWQFMPVGIDIKRSIQFHEPHPQVKMHFWLAKRVGRRLNRAYGWDGKTFVCK